ncbi:hypothetical protein PHMEG_00019839 [Phytophthora megakarya]|uniref:Uncharacterized protein n=1 Tax=Phytophthora megakarya TaxID=4795 RepID=A0A225VQX4_9STRA|nr:hypothetical protein PHMEG_00019839 [Phytophthora megakarya]
MQLKDIYTLEDVASDIWKDRLIIRPGRTKSVMATHEIRMVGVTIAIAFTTVAAVNHSVYESHLLMQHCQISSPNYKFARLKKMSTITRKEFLSVPINYWLQAE